MEKEIIKPGVYADLSNDNYHSSTGISKSGLDLVAKCPAIYHHRYILGNRPEATKAMIIGSAVHTAALEPEKFTQEFVVEPKIDKRTKDGKAEYAEFLVLSEGKKLISPEDYELCMSVAEAVQKHPLASSILSSGQAETSIYHDDIETGELVKVRPDWITDDLIVDLKTTQCASADEFAKSCFNFRYYVQAAMYLDVANAEMYGRFSNFLFICVEKTEPYQVAIYFADKEMLELGYQEYRKALSLYSACKIDNHWLGYNDNKITPISLPYWAERKLAA